MIPIHPDEQLRMMVEQSDFELNQSVHPLDAEKIFYYTTEVCCIYNLINIYSFIKFQGIDNEILSPYPEIYWNVAKTTILPKWKELLEFFRILQDCRRLIMICYEFSQKSAILEYILHDPIEKKRIGINMYPAVYRPIIITAPMPWHASYITAKEKMRINLYITHIVLTELRDLWNNK